MKTLEDVVNGYDFDKVETEPDEYFDLLRVNFNITNINNLDLILQCFFGLFDTDVANSCDVELRALKLNLAEFHKT